MLKTEANTPRLDIGGGTVKPGWTTIDLNPTADMVHNLNKFPYPFRDNTFSEMRMYHTLEHLKYPFKVMKELYRIAQPRCIIEIRIPWWEYDMFSHPCHINWFRPRWFYWLTTEPQKRVGVRDNIGDMVFCQAMRHQYGGIDWRVVRDHVTRGKHKFWKKYQYTVWLEAVK